MGKRYYCDYCDRLIADSVQERKKHLAGSQHKNNRKAHYDQYRDLKTIVEEERNKQPCFKYLQHGKCSFNENCYRSHVPRETLDFYQFKISEDKHMKTVQQISELKTITSWIESRNIIDSQSVLKTYSGMGQSNNINSYPGFNHKKELPLSLQGLNADDNFCVNVPKWG